jgi:hypothetical protein
MAIVTAPWGKGLAYAWHTVYLYETYRNLGLLNL